MPKFKFKQVVGGSVDQILGYFASYQDDLLAPEFTDLCTIRRVSGQWHTMGLSEEFTGPTRKHVANQVVDSLYIREANAILQSDAVLQSALKDSNPWRDDRGLTERLANEVYTLLVKEVGARDEPEMRRMFIYSHHDAAGNHPHYSHEYRFGGCLGFGGKFWNESNGFRVSAYSEDITPQKQLRMARCNKRLQELYLLNFGELQVIR